MRLLLAGLFVLAEIAAAGARFDTPFQRGEALKAASRWEEAMTAYRDAWGKAEDERENAKATYRIGQMLDKLNRTWEGTLWLKRSLEYFHYQAVEDELKRMELDLRKTPRTAEQIREALLLPPDRSPGVVPAVDLEILFGYDSSVLTTAGVAQAQELGRALSDKGLKSGRFEIVGHTDKRGSDAYNQALSEQRAKAVAAFLQQKCGIAPGRLVARGMGKRQLLHAGETEEDHRINRRVEVRALK